MRRLSALVLALSLVACGDDTISHLANENHETVLVAVNTRGEVFLATKKSPVTLQELPGEVE